MDIVLGIRLQDCVVIATSKAFTRGISILKASDDKTRLLNTTNLMAFTGESGDTVQFAEYIQANVQLFSMREGNNGSGGRFEMTPKEIASFVRNQLAKSIRSRSPYQVQVLLGGYDLQEKVEEDAPFLSMIDYLGTRVDLPYAAHGYAAFYTMSLLDRHYHKGMKLEEGLELIRKCNEELTLRMPMDFKGLSVKVVSKEGVKEIEL